MSSSLKTIPTTVRDVALIRETVREFAEFLIERNIILVYSVHQDIPAVPNIDKLISEFISCKLTAAIATTDKE